jgi:hypothetical protein
MMTTRYSLATARAAAAEGRLAEWVGDFLASRGSDNAALAAGLAQRPHRWWGPLRVDLDHLVRLAGPEDEVECPIEPEEWEDDVESMEAEVEEGWEPPPLLAELRGGELLVQDGNHRYEALLRAGEPSAWVIVWSDDVDAELPPSVDRTHSATSASDPTRS